MHGLAEACSVSSACAGARAVCSVRAPPAGSGPTSTSAAPAYAFREGLGRRRARWPAGLDTCNRRRRHAKHGRHSVTTAGLPFAAPEFQSSKLRIHNAESGNLDIATLENRYYTLTHNDLTGELYLTVGQTYNLQQISGWYNRLVRDEILAEWVPNALGNGSPTLHVHCHVSGEERWLAPPSLRDFIFQREMSLVLDCIVYAETDCMMRYPEVVDAQVQVHFHSDIAALNRTEAWGALGDRSSWRALPLTIFEEMWARMTKEGPSCDLSHLPPEADVPTPSETVVSSTEETMEPVAVVLDAVTLSGIVPGKLDPPPVKSPVKAKSTSCSQRYSRFQEQNIVPIPVPVVAGASRRTPRSRRYN